METACFIFSRYLPLLLLIPEVPGFPGAPSFPLTIIHDVNTLQIIHVNIIFLIILFFNS